VNLTFSFEYRKLGDFTYHVISDPTEIKNYLMKFDHNQAPEEHWTVNWMNALPQMEFRLGIVDLNDICPNPDLMSIADFQVSLKERADEREESILRGISIEPLLINQNGFELMDGYTRYTVLKRYEQKEVYAYVGEMK
jgi:hypothetical protein